MSSPPIADQRARILDAALTLMGEQGAQPTTMRQLAAACDINVATLYHYFPSKADLLSAVLDERNYLDELSVQRVPITVEGTPSERLRALIRWVAEMAVNEDAVWRLVLGETLRGEPVAVSMARRLATGLDEALARWIVDLVPEFAGDPEVAGRVIRTSVISLLIDRLLVDETEVDAVIDARTDDLVSLLLASA